MLQPPALAKAPGVLPLLVLALLGVAHPEPAAAIGFTPIAMSNQPAPGFAAGTLYSPLCCTTGSSQFRLSESGAVAFTASTTALNRLGLPARGLWVRDETGSTSLVAGEGMPVPGAPGATYDGNVLQFEINARGHVAFGSPVIGGGPCCSNINALFGPDPGGGVRMVLRGGDPAPGIGGDATLSPLQMRIDINDSDEVAVSGLLRGPEITGANDSAVWTSDPSGPLVVRVREGDPAPGSGTFPHVSLNNYYRGSSVNDAGQILVRGSSTASQPTDLWLSEPTGAAALVVSSGQTLPGSSKPVQQLFDSGMLLNERGQVAFSAVLDGGAAADEDAIALWDPVAGPGIRARSGAPAPGTASGTVFGHLSTHAFASNDEGGIAFAAELLGPGVDAGNDYALYGPDGAGGLRIVMREGAAVPGLPGISFLTFYEDELGDHDDSIAAGSATAFGLNDRGDVAFAAALSGPGVDGRNDRAIFYSRVDGSLELVLRLGDQLEVAPGELRTVVRFPFFDLIEMNDRGELVVPVELGGFGQAVFLARVPEPGAGTLLVGGSLALAWRGRRVAG